MFTVILGLFFTLVEISLGYLVPVAFILQSALQSNKDGMIRWLTHFVFIASLRCTLFWVFGCLGDAGGTK
jgi:hypothetical protein